VLNSPHNRISRTFPKGGHERLWRKPFEIAGLHTEFVHFDRSGLASGTSPGGHELKSPLGGCGVPAQDAVDGAWIESLRLECALQRPDKSAAHRRRGQAQD
jgi:hypothetical protein